MATHVDYEAAWIDLADHLRAKPGWGTKELHSAMAEIAARHRMPEHFVHTVLRLYAGDVHLSIDTPETGAALIAASSTDDEKPPDPGSSTAHERSHDEHDPDRTPAHA